MIYKDILHFSGAPGLFLLLLAAWAVVQIPKILYINTLRTTLLEVFPANRLMNPSMLWTLLIPVWGILYSFYAVSKIADSLGLDLKERNLISNEERPTYAIGFAMSILTLIGNLPFILRILSKTNLIPIDSLINAQFLGFLMPFATFGAFVCWIVYWVSVSKYKTILQVDNFGEMGDLSDATE